MENLLVLFSKAEGDCHACGAITAGIVLSNQGGRWVLRLKSDSITTAGAFGSPPKPKLIAIGKDNYAIRFELGDMHQGYRTSYAIHYLIGNNEFIEVLASNIGGDNSGADEKGLGIFSSI